MNKKLTSPSTRILPLQQPSLTNTETKAVIEVFESKWLGRGPLSETFERELQDFIGTRHIIACNTGTSALHLALACLNLKPGNEVILPSLTFAACPQAVLMAGGIPLFCEVKNTTLNLDPADVRQRITEKTKAIMPVHFGGEPCDMDEFENIANEYDIRIIEDGAHAFGSQYKTRNVGTLGDLAAFSFDPIKTITCGEGGAVATNNNEFAKQIRLMRNLGLSTDGWKHLNTLTGKNSSPSDSTLPNTLRTLGFRYHLPDLNAAIGLAQLKRFKTIRQIRRRLVSRYDEAFQKHNGLSLIFHDLKNSVPFFYVVRVCSSVRERFITHLHKAGISTGLHYPPNHLQPFFRSAKKTNLPVTEQLFTEITTLPLFPDMTDHEQDRVIQAVDSFGDFS